MAKFLIFYHQNKFKKKIFCHNFKACSRTLLQGEPKEALLRQALTPNLDYLRKKALHKRMLALSKKCSLCTHCGFLNGAQFWCFKVSYQKCSKFTNKLNFANKKPWNQILMVSPKIKFKKNEKTFNSEAFS